LTLRTGISGNWTIRPHSPRRAARVASSPPATSSLDGITLTISAKNEIQQVVAPLTTAISTREYAVGGLFNESITGSAAATPSR